MTIALVPGQNFSLVKDSIYALPARRCLATMDDSSATVVTSDDISYTKNIGVTLSANGQFETSGGFIKLTSTGPSNIFLATY